MNAEKYNLDRIYFGGCFIRGIAQLFDWLSENSSSWGRACCNYRDTIICHSVLEQGHKASAVPPPRRISVGVAAIAGNVTIC